jgi:hypothetical protein
MKEHIKRTLRNHYYQTVIIYSFIYLFYSFVTWSLINPFQWVLDIPTMDISGRMFIILSFLCYNGVGIFMRYDITKPKK